jgi:hypothetical protein
MGLLHRRYQRWLALILDAYSGDGRRYIVQPDGPLSAFPEVEATLL